MRALLLSPVPRLAVFLGKAVAIAALILAVALGRRAAARAVARRAARSSSLASWRWSSCSASLGIAFVGSVFAATLLKVRSRDVLLPVILYPLLVPLFVAGTQATDGARRRNSQPRDGLVLDRFLGIYDAAFLVLSLWIFESLVIE